MIQELFIKDISKLLRLLSEMLHIRHQQGSYSTMRNSKKFLHLLFIYNSMCKHSILMALLTNILLQGNITFDHTWWPSWLRFKCKLHPTTASYQVMDSCCNLSTGWKLFVAKNTIQLGTILIFHLYIKKRLQLVVYILWITYQTTRLQTLQYVSYTI